MNRHLARALGATALGALLLQPVITMADPPAHARNENSAKYRGYSQSQERYDDDDRHWDSHNYYSRRGHFVYYLPPKHRVVHHHGHRYYYGNGAWYQPYGPRYVVVDPPVGLVVPFLPQFGATMYFGGMPHYRSGPVYYVWNPRARGYVVTDRPHRW
jgi:hypothetical protein